MMILIIRCDNFIKRKTIIDNKSQQMGLGQYTPQTTKSENLLFCVSVIIHTNDSKSPLNQYIYIQLSANTRKGLLFRQEDHKGLLFCRILG